MTDDYYKHPEKYQPLGSIKGVKNAAGYDYNPNSLDIRLVFTSKSNILLLTQSLYVINKQNGGTESFDYIFLQIKNKLIPEFLSVEDVYSYKNVEYQATGNYNWTEILKAINGQFMKHCYNSISWNQFVPTRVNVTVGPRCNRQEKKMYELQASDIGTIDYWRSQETQILNKQFRYGNKIPIWQVSMHKRRYDTGNEGLHHNEPDRASLESPVYNSYDMSSIHNTLNQWTKEGWFGV